MPSSLPRHPNLGHLKMQAKMLLAAQRRGVPASCTLFRRIRRFSAQSDEEILEATVSLAEAQLALAMHNGYSSWKELIDEARSYPPSSDFSLKAVAERSEEAIPDYAGAGVPSAVVAALNHAGVPVGFMEFVAASGWSFSFGYLYHDISPAYMAVRCSEVWLRSVAGTQTGDAKGLLTAVADHYGEAFRNYDLYLGEIEGCTRPHPDLQERTRTPERIRAVAPLLERAIAEEALALEALEEAMKLLE